MRRAMLLVAALAVLSAPASARAFCGFYVAGADASLYNNATMVVMMRDGTRTVLAMRNDYQGPPEDFALVIPVPVVLQEDNVKTLDKELFEHVDQLSAPRLVEYWEQDPCQQALLRERRAREEEREGVRPMAAAAEAPGDLGVTIEAQFVVGEYQIVILSARDSAGLETWLHQENYNIPEGAEEVLRPYVQAGTKFFVAKVDVTKVRFEHGHAMLSPLRFHYDTDEFSLPVRLGLLNSNGTQDLIVHILAPDQRYEVANYPNVTIPTNIRVAPDVRERFGEFYAALFDETLERNPRAVITEYAWQASNCDPCPGPVLSASDLMSLGADVLPSTSGGGQRATVTMGAPTIQGSAQQPIVQAVLQQRVEPIKSCVQGRIAAGDSVSGAASLSVTIGPDGLPAEPTVSGAVTEGVRACVAAEAAHIRLPPPENGSHVTLRVPFVFGVETENPRQSQQRLMSFVLTRLHARYTREGLGEDLVFRPAPKIVGGRGMPNAQGEMPRDVQADASVNNFQGRYAILHPWEGALDCEGPIRGVWGGPPAGRQGGGVEPATNLAFAPRGRLQLAGVVRQDIPEISLTAQVTPEPIPVSPVPGSTGPGATGGGGGCGSCSASGVGGGLPPMLGLGLAWLARRRRRRS